MTVSPESSAVRPVFIGQRLMTSAIALLLLVATLIGLSATVPISGAVIASGQVAVESNVKKVQHPTGGVIASIRVRDGDHVSAGDVLATLDRTSSQANTTIMSTAVAELEAKEARLKAERDSNPAMPRDNPSVGPVAEKAWREELHLFQLHRQSQEGQKAQLRERIAQLRQQIVSYEEGAKAKGEQIDLINGELSGVRDLFKQNLVPISRLNALERDAAQLRGDIAQLRAAGAEAHEKISETELQIIQVDQSARSEAGNQLGEVQNQLSELRQKLVIAQQEFRRVEIRAPQSGTVDRLSVHTVGGVIGPAEPIMLIVPDKDRLHVEAKLKPTDVDHVRVGQKATLRFSAFDQRTTPEIPGLVSHVSAEAQTEEKTGASYYIVDIEFTADRVSRLGLNLVPGMPVEAFIQTGGRSLLSYLTKPLVDQFKRAFREG